jgi:hypothetical protein
MVNYWDRDQIDSTSAALVPAQRSDWLWRFELSRSPVSDRFALSGENDQVRAEVG